MAAHGVLGNDSDVDGDTLTASLATGPANGFAILNADGCFSYTPNTGFLGDDSFTYAASDGSLSDSATITITVSEPTTGTVAHVETTTGACLGYRCHVYHSHI